MDKEIKSKVKAYYIEKFNKFGETPQGVDWNSIDSQNLRFKQLIKLLPQDSNETFTLLDYGCGYGAMASYIKTRYKNCIYYGYDISELPIKKAKDKFPEFYWSNKISKNFKFDYVIASGIFNVKIDTPDKEWQKFILKTIMDFNNLSKSGFAFNCLTSYSDTEHKKDYLYYTNPLLIFDYCKINCSKFVTLLHDYPLFEFSILIKKDAYE